MKLIKDSNDVLLKYENEAQHTSVQEENLRLIDRNITINNINPQDSDQDLIEIIKYQTSYYTSVDSKYVNHLPDPATKIETIKGQRLTLRTFLLNAKPQDQNAGAYNLFTQVDKGLTIKTTERKKYPSRNGITFTFHQTNTTEVNKYISQLPSTFEREIKEEFHHLLIPKASQTLPPELFKDTTLRKTTYAKQVIKRMQRLQTSSHTTSLTTSTRPLPIRNHSQPFLTAFQIRSQVRQKKHQQITTNTPQHSPTPPSTTTSISTMTTSHSNTPHNTTTKNTTTKTNNAPTIITPSTLTTTPLTSTEIIPSLPPTYSPTTSTTLIPTTQLPPNSHEVSIQHSPNDTFQQLLQFQQHTKAEFAARDTFLIQQLSIFKNKITKTTDTTKQNFQTLQSNITIQSEQLKKLENNLTQVLQGINQLNSTQPQQTNNSDLEDNQNRHT